MYEAFYGFKEKPFSMLPDPGFLFLSKKHQAALTLLEYGVLNQVGFCVISGEAGAGKTTIIRALLERVAENVSVGLITNTHQSFGGLLDWVLSAYDLHQPNLSQVEMHQIFMEYLIEEYAGGRTVLLIVDEAQNMKPDALEELRMLSNVNSDKDQLMQVVLAGQPALKETLRKPELMQFAQRIAVDYHLEQLSVVETCGYIQHRLVTAGADHDIFTPAACERIHCYSGGTPRLINLLCETVLVYGFADQQDMIEVELVDEMVQERMKDSVVPIVNRDAAKNNNKEAALALEKDFPWISADKNPAVASTEDKPDVKAKSNSDVKNVAEDSVRYESAGSKSETTPTAKKESATTTAGQFEKTKVAKAVSLKAEPIKGSAANRGKKKPVKPVQGKVTSQTSSVLPQENDGKKTLFKYAAIAVVFLLIIVAGFVFLGSKNHLSDVADSSDSVDTEKGESGLALQQQRKQEEERIKQLRAEAEKLKKERDAAIASAEAEKRAKYLAEKQAAAKAAVAVKAAEDKRKLEDKKRLADVKKRERLAKQQEAKVKADTEKLRLETARLEEERQLMKARLEKETRLAEESELRRLEREWKEKQRLELEIARIRAEQQAIADAAAKVKIKEKNKTTECSGPAAKFKAGCR